MPPRPGVWLKLSFRRQVKRGMSGKPQVAITEPARLQTDSQAHTSDDIGQEGRKPEGQNLASQSAVPKALARPKLVYEIQSWALDRQMHVNEMLSRSERTPWLPGSSSYR